MLKERFKFKDSSYLLIGTTGILLVVQELKLKSFTVFNLKVCYSCGIEKEMSDIKRNLFCPMFDDSK